MPERDELDPKRTVAEGYDRVGGRYAELATREITRHRRKYTDLLLDRVPPGAKVLDLGCGAGVPTTRELAQKFAVTGVDISKRQVARARSNVPRATFVQSDMAEAEFASESFDAVAAFYSIIHLPRDEQPAMLQASRISCTVAIESIALTTIGLFRGRQGYCPN